MSEVLEQVKSAAYTSVGVNLLVTDAIVGRELPAPEFIEEHATLARKHATKALKDFRAFSEPRAVKLTEQLPSSVAAAITDNQQQSVGFHRHRSPSGSHQGCNDHQASHRQGEKARHRHQDRCKGKSARRRHEDRCR